MAGADPSFRLDSDFTPAGSEPGFVTLTLHNLSDRPVTKFRLALTALFRIQPGSGISGGEIVEQVSNYHVIAPPADFVLKPAGVWSVSAARLSHTLAHYNYGPKSAYLILDDGRLEPVATTPMTQKGGAGRPLIDPAPRPKRPANTPPLALLPFPRAAEVSGQREPGPLSLVDGPDEARAAFATASGLAGRLFPTDPPIFGGTGGIALRARREAISDDAYRIAFTPEEVTVFAGSRSGFLYAFITLGQLSRGARVAPGEFVFPATGEISDQPRFGWRGMHLDVARQPYDIAHVERFLDSLAWEKLNRFHLHLTDDEGWRFDVPGYPQLADIAAWRGHGLAVPPLLGSPAARHGVVYSRAELGGLVRRAGELGVTIVPEVDIPGHCYCVLQAIPALRDPGETGIYRSIQYFPNDALNPAVPGTYDFLEAVLGELASIFPSPWLHVGGDEVADDAWLGSPAALALMKERGWTEIHQLQAYFLQRVQRMISGLGRGTGAWEEAALGGGIDPTGSYLVAWRKSASGLALAEQGYAVVLAPAQHYYLDMAQSDEWWEPGASWAGTVSPETSYAYEPGSDWPDTAKPRLLGVQACLWSENMHERRLVDHMTFPRLSALAETAWTPVERKDFRRFSAIAPLMPRTGG